jgi:hypothetical protein
MTGKTLAIAVLVSLTLAASGLVPLRPALRAQTPSQMQMGGATDQGIPSYHAYKPEPPIPSTLDPKQFPDALNHNVYALAGRIRPVLFQQPCYCYCDRSIGHKSLLDCFGSTHGTQCDICQKEAVYAYQQTQKGKTPSQIRAGIIRGEWNAVDLKPYMSGTVSR